MREGKNIVIPIVGATESSVNNYINAAKKAGYEVYLHLNEVSNSKALARVVKRYLKEGRFIDPRCVWETGDLPTQVYEKIKNRSDISGYAKWNNESREGKSLVCKEIKGEKLGACEVFVREYGETRKRTFGTNDAGRGIIS